jgi:hypothetical protein
VKEKKKISKKLEIILKMDFGRLFFLLFFIMLASYMSSAKMGHFC